MTAATHERLGSKAGTTMALPGLEWMEQETADERARIASRISERERALRARQAADRAARIAGRERKAYSESDAAGVAAILRMEPLEFPSA
jgi:hypothetical protein